MQQSENAPLAGRVAVVTGASVASERRSHAV